MPGLVGVQTLVLDQSGVMLDHPVGDHDVAHRQRRIQPTRDAGEDHCAAVESVGQHGRYECAIHLAHPRTGDDDVAAVQRSRGEFGVADPDDVLKDLDRANNEAVFFMQVTGDNTPPTPSPR